MTVLGTVEEVAEAGCSTREADDSGAQMRKRASLLERLRRVVALVFSDANSALRFAMVAALLLVVVSVVVLRLGYHRPQGGHLGTLDALYFTVETIETVSTVGFGDFYFSHQAAWIEVFGILLILAGATLVTTVFALVTNALVSWRIEQSLGRQQVIGMEGHVVVVGLGSVGIRVLEGLQAVGREVVVIERSERNRYLNQARALGPRC